MEDCPQDCGTELAHILIRAEACDGFDPFMLHGHPNVPQIEHRVVRVCFYYAMVVTPKLTALYDNDGRGGMCDMTADEVRAIWRTDELLAALGTDFEALSSGTATFTDGAVPKAIYSWDVLSAKNMPLDETPAPSI